MIFLQPKKMDSLLKIFFLIIFLSFHYCFSYNVVYHASPVQNLKIIKSSGLHHGKHWIYATPDKAFAATYLAKWEDLDFSQGRCDSKEKSIHFVERYPHALEEIFGKAKNSSIYTLSSDGFLKGQTASGSEVVKENSATVLKEIKIKNPFNYLKKMAQKNKIRLFYYPSRPECVPRDDNDIIQIVVKSVNKGNTQTRKNFLRKHPHLEEQLKIALKNQK